MTLIKPTYGVRAFSNLEKYDEKISRNFELAVHMGRIISSWDEPEFLPANTARHMRDSDYVIGLNYKGIQRAYPLWIADNYHVVNDEIDGQAIIFVTCERCQTGAFYHASVNGVPRKFSGMGMYNASLTLVNQAKKLGKKSGYWLHYEGVCLTGENAGHFLEQIPAFHCTWREWRDRYPETDVLCEPVNDKHKDARHGHGREEYFCRPGMDTQLIQTITGALDTRYPENELVLGLNMDQGVKAYPLAEVKKDGGVVNDNVGGVPVAIFSGPLPDQFTMSAFLAEIDGTILSFELRKGQFIDGETSSCWDIEGICLSGPYLGRQLAPLRFHVTRWHSWIYPHRSSGLFLSHNEQKSHSELLSSVENDTFREMMGPLIDAGYDVNITGEIIHLKLPHEAVAGLHIIIDGDPHNLYLFACATAAADYSRFEGQWYCFPLGTKIGRKKSISLGPVVLESDPARQYTDMSQAVRLPDADIKWSSLIVDDSARSFWPTLVETITYDPRNSFFELYSYLKKSGYDVVETSFLPHGQLRVGTNNAMAATINADRFIVYKCETIASVDTLMQEMSHSLAIGKWVLRSCPVDMYKDPINEIGSMKEEEIHWSPLIEKPRFARMLQKFVSVDARIS